MAESNSRSLRVGALEGEHAPALTLKDSLQSPFGSHAFNHFLSSLISNIATSKSQARGLVLVALTRSTLFYLDLVKAKGFDASLIRILDGYSDPLGWKDGILKLGYGGSDAVKESVDVFRNVKDVAKLLSAILALGKGFVGDGKVRYAVTIDSVSVILRHASLSSVSSLISNRYFAVMDPGPRTSAALEYISTMVASLEPMVQYIEGHKSPQNLFLIEQISHEGKFHVRLKQRNGKVKQLFEKFHMERGGIKFTDVSSENLIVSQNLIPKDQFNLQLSEKERADRAKVVLPFEHQDDDAPDSDEDPDDDLDI